MLDLVRILGAVHRGVLHVVHREILGLPSPSPELHQDAPHVGLGDDLLRKILRYVHPQAQLAFDFMAKDVDRSSARGAELVGIKPRTVPGLATVIGRARDANVSLITRASESFLEQVRDVLEEHEGERPEEIADLLEERVGVSESRATLIARDQVLKLNGQITKHRQESAGVTRFRWSTSRDERVRATHREIDGQVFTWEEGADLEDEDEPTFPGQPIQCRCVAIPVIEELEEPDESEAGEEEAEAADPGVDVAAEE